jgi:uncharacterized metal-binding protein (TIGR02443 family)
MTKFIQFIAGAICPSCKAMDSIAINRENDQIYCVKCDYKEDRPKEKIPNKQTSMLLILKITKKLNASNIIDKKIL